MSVTIKSDQSLAGGRLLKKVFNYQVFFKITFIVDR